jgi:hypothetical protein
MEKDISTNKYNEMLREIIAEVKMTRVIVANRLSATVTQLYWNIGKRLSIEKLEKGYGGRVVEQLSADLKSEFPDTEGFSPRSLLDMKRLYEFYTNGFQKSPQVVAVLSRGYQQKKGISFKPHDTIVRQRGLSTGLGLMLIYIHLNKI